MAKLNPKHLAERKPCQTLPVGLGGRFKMKSVNFTDTFCVGKLIARAQRQCKLVLHTHTTHAHAHACTRTHARETGASVPPLLLGSCSRPQPGAQPHLISRRVEVSPSARLSSRCPGDGDAPTGLGGWPKIHCGRRRGTPGFWMKAQLCRPPLGGLTPGVSRGLAGALPRELPVQQHVSALGLQASLLCICGGR